MVAFDIIYPRIVIKWDEDPPRGLPLPYLGQNVMGSLPFVPFSQPPTKSDRKQYDSWIKQYRDKRKGIENDILGTVEGEQLTESSLYSLAPKTWLMDTVITAFLKSIVKLHPLEPSVGFLPHFFYTRLTNVGHSNPDIEFTYDYQAVRTWAKRKLGKGKKVSDMNTLVVFRNPNGNHWVCYVIFLKKKFIQEFDSMGGGDVQALKNLYRWLHDSMKSEGQQELTPTDWCLYTARSEAPRQENGYDCGLFTIMSSLCIANDLALNLVHQSMMETARCQLWLYLMKLVGKIRPQSTLDLAPPETPTSPGSVVDLQSPITVSRTLTYPEMDDESDDVDNTNDDPKSSSSNKVRKWRQRRPKGKQKEQDEELATEEELKNTIKKTKKRAKWEQEESPTRTSTRGKVLVPADQVFQKEPAWAKRENPSRVSSRNKSTPASSKSTPKIQEPPSAARLEEHNKDESSPLEDQDEGESSPLVTTVMSPVPDEEDMNVSPVDEPMSRIDETPPSATTVLSAVPEEEDMNVSHVDNPMSRIDETPPLATLTVDDPMSRIDKTPPLVKFAKSPKPEVDDGGEDHSLDDKDDGSTERMKAQFKSMLKLTAKHQIGHSPQSSRKRMLLPTQTKSADKLKLTKKLSPSPKKKIYEDDTILKSPIIQGLMKSQKDVTTFFQREAALERKKAEDSAERRRTKGDRNLNKTPEEIRHLAKLAKETRLAEARKRIEAKEELEMERTKALEKEEEEKRRSQGAAFRLHKKIYKSLTNNTRRKGKTVDRKVEQELLRNLNDNFKIDDKDEEEPHEVDENAIDSPLEIYKLRYHKAEFQKKKEATGKYRFDIQESPEHFSGMMKDPKGGDEIVSKKIDPRWVRYHFHGVFVELVMLSPNVWFPVPVGNSRPTDDKAPGKLLVTKILIRYQQFDRNLCLLMGVASCLHYCGLKEVAVTLSNEAMQFANLSRDLGITKLKETMLKVVPCIGDCTIFNVRNAKKRTIKKLSIEDLITEKTRFPTIIIPLAKDGSINHAVVVIDDIIFDSTQAFALKLCRESLDWVCGEKGIASIHIGLRFNRGNATKDKLKHVDTLNW